MRANPHLRRLERQRQKAAAERLAAEQAAQEAAAEKIRLAHAYAERQRTGRLAGVYARLNLQQRLSGRSTLFAV